ncbi:4141_t:CDS:2 [Dentiscutata erythropus]|uniref:4141_t:CDS:1 n=1 Tax=Dentiscutata erythropus TaxID=1348616 RepID=A0A9N9F6Z6_9GLOM|nr:4141_t:CDS:2 [Dentiscutata erythropus]
MSSYVYRTPYTRTPRHVREASNHSLRNRNNGEGSSSNSKSSSSHRSTSTRGQGSHSSSNNMANSSSRAENNKSQNNAGICRFFLQSRYCIKEWRKTDNLSTPFQTTDTTKTCPVCRKNSPYIVPSPSFAKAGQKKDQIILSYKERMSRIPCKYFQESRKCPFADECFYKHANPDGSRCSLGPPKKKKPRTCSLGNFRYLEVTGEGSGFDFRTISEILGGLSINRSIHHIFTRDWDNWDDEMDFDEGPTWDDDFPFEDQINEIVSFGPDNNDVDEPEVEEDDNGGWGSGEWGSTWDDFEQDTTFSGIHQESSWW